MFATIFGIFTKKMKRSHRIQFTILLFVQMILILGFSFLLTLIPLFFNFSQIRLIADSNSNTIPISVILIYIYAIFFVSISFIHLITVMRRMIIHYKTDEIKAKEMTFVPMWFYTSTKEYPIPEYKTLLVLTLVLVLPLAGIQVLLIVAPLT